MFMGISITCKLAADLSIRPVQFLGNNASNSTGVLGPKCEWLPIFIKFRHLTMSQGLQNIALSVVIGLKTQTFARDVVK